MSYFFRRSGSERKACGSHRVHLQVERLDDRTVPSTFTVTNLLDSDAGSLRKAILDANSPAYPGADVINFAPSLKGTIPLSSGQLTITDALTINGPGASAITVSGNQASRVFEIAASVPVSISGLTIAGGKSSDFHGGGILNNGTLALNNAAVSDNWAGEGGGLYNSGTVTVTACTFTGNYGDWSGSALYNVGTLALSNSTVSGNTVGSSYYDDDGYYYGDGYGCIGAEPGSLTNIANSTIWGNNGYCGGIFASWWTGEGTIHARNTIIANNTFCDVVGNLGSLGHNLIGNANTLYGSGFRPDLGDLLNPDPVLVQELVGPLQDNGGPTFTHALKPGSLAIDAGDSDSTDAPLYDQRGEGYPRIVNGTIDIGAYELQSQQSQASTTTTVTASANPSTFGQQMTFTAAVTASGGPRRAQ